MLVSPTSKPVICHDKAKINYVISPEMEAEGDQATDIQSILNSHTRRLSCGAASEAWF